MKIKIWGCLGSITTPGPTTLRYGGNSTCLEIRTKTGQIIIIDAGSGIRNLGKALAQEKEVTQVRFFFTHSHWDHLTVFPFFKPAYSDTFSVTFCSGPHAQDSIRKYLTHQMEAPFFPVDFNLLRAKFNFRCQRPHTFQGLVADVMKQDRSEMRAAEEKARGLIVPGVMLQPSGIFAVARAQDLGCSYVWAV